uniref:Putative secreted peptide n=1 Tax=Anopheles braziliensis TaxID=58242 RepID=A0A2M3ZQX1_9DIPT
MNHSATISLPAVAAAVAAAPADHPVAHCRSSLADCRLWNPAGSMSRVSIPKHCVSATAEATLPAGWPPRVDRQKRQTGKWFPSTESASCRV